MGMGSLKDHWMEQRSDEDIRVVDWRHHELVLARLNYVQNPNWFHGRLDSGSAGNGAGADDGEYYVKRDNPRKRWHADQRMPQK
jgi:hypothetical protein